PRLPAQVPDAAAAPRYRRTAICRPLRGPGLSLGVSPMNAHTKPRGPDFRVRSDAPFYVGLGIVGGSYVLLIVGMLLAEASFTSFGDLQTVLADERIRYAIKLSLISCSMTTLLSLWVAVPLGYLMSRHNFPGKVLVDALLDIPIVLP